MWTLEQDLRNLLDSDSLRRRRRGWVVTPDRPGERSLQFGLGWLPRVDLAGVEYRSVDTDPLHRRAVRRAEQTVQPAPRRRHRPCIPPAPVGTEGRIAWRDSRSPPACPSARNRGPGPAPVRAGHSIQPEPRQVRHESGEAALVAGVAGQREGTPQDSSIPTLPETGAGMPGTPIAPSARRNGKGTSEPINTSTLNLESSFRHSARKTMGGMPTPPPMAMIWGLAGSGVKPLPIVQAR